MKKIRNMLSKVSRNIRKRYVVAGLVVALVGLGGIAAKAEFYPDRKPFDYNKACNPDDADIYDRCGSLTGPVFNSFINTPSYGDERAFLDARRSDQTASGSFKNVLTNVTEGSQEVVLRTYIHNNANQTTNDKNGVAKNTKVRIALPTASGQALRARSYISADNSAPKLVEDTVDMVAGEDFNVSYIAGSATLYNNGPFKNGVKISDNIVKDGAPIGYDALNGNMPGCFDFEAVVQIRVKVTPKKVPGVEFNKEVAVAGQNGWGENVTVKPGENVKWLMSFANKGTADLTNVTMSDKLPPHLKVVPGSVKWIYSGTNGQTQTVGQNDTQVFTTGGINFGKWAPNGGFYVRFDTTAKDDFEGCEVRLRNIAYNHTSQTTEGEDSADVTIKKDNCQPKVPKYSCDLLDLKAGSDRNVTLTEFKQSASGGATFKDAVIDWGDKSTPLTTNSVVGKSHRYEKDGDYVVTATARFTVNGKVVTAAENIQCRKAVSFKPNVPPTTTTPPTSTTKLPDTGAGEVMGIFAATTAAGALAHKFVWTRRFAR